MKIFLDENMSPNLCHGLQAFQKSLNAELKFPIQIFSIEEQYGRGAQDEDWVPLVGKERGMAITWDFNLMRTRHQRELCEKHGVGLVIIRANSKKQGMRFWEQVKLLVKYWEDVVKVASKKSGHFHYELKPTSGLRELK
jgi:hypothetical protein